MSGRTARRWRPRVGRLILALLVLAGPHSLGPLGGNPPTRAADGPLVRASVEGSPFRAGTGPRARVTLVVRLVERAHLRVEVLRFGGARVRTLARAAVRDEGRWVFRWDGRDGSGRPVPDGPYRLRVTATRGTSRLVLDRWVTKASATPRPRVPGAIVVAINPGHGGSDPGASSRGLDESDVNLDIALRVARMLEGAGVGVIMTRDRDRDVNRPLVDVDRDGDIDHHDELVARLDIANLARADLTLNIHNNATSCHCASGTQTLVDPRRPWGARSVALGRAVQGAIVRRLRAFEGRAWRVRDRGLGRGAYVSLSGARVAGPRPGLMPTVLGESLFIDQPGDRGRLASATVRTAIAAGYYEGVMRWLDRRGLAARYTDVAVPASVGVGAAAEVRVRIRATGRRALAGWRLEARLVRAVPVLDGSGAIGRLVGSVPLARLEAGRSEVVSLPIVAPDEARDWLLTLDLVRGSTRLSRLGVVRPQVPFSTLGP